MSADDKPTFAEVLARAQIQMTGAAKDSKNPHFKSSYASLASVVDAIRQPLGSQGIGWTQEVTCDAEVVSCATVLLHGTQEYRYGRITARAKDASPQAIGSTVTYLRRYSLMATLGIPAEDDDGEAAHGRSDSRASSTPASNAGPHPIDAEPGLVDAWLKSLGKSPISERPADALRALRQVLDAGGSQRQAYDQWKASHAK